MQGIVHNKEFDKTRTSEYNLSIRISPDGFVFCISDCTNKIIAVSAEECFAPEIPELISKAKEAHETLKSNFKNTYVMWQSQHYTIVPQAIFDERETETFWKLNFSTAKDDETLMFNNITANSTVLIFSISQKTKSVILEHFPTAKIIHEQTSSITSTILQSKDMNEDLLTLTPSSDFFCATLARKGKLELANSYEYAKIDDLLYFTLLIFEQLELDQYATKVQICKSEKSTEKQIIELGKYVKQTKWAEPHQSVKIDEEINIDISKTTTLFNMHLCV